MNRNYLLATIGLALGIASAHASAATLPNGGFETTDIGSGNYYYPGANIYTGGSSVPSNYISVPDWSFTGGSGIINAQGSNAWYGGSSPTGFVGNQYGFVQGGAGSDFSQSFSVAAGSAGLGTVSWLSGGRPNFGSYSGDQTYNVLLNNIVIATDSTVAGQNFIAESASGIFTAGVNTLEFQGVDPLGGDETSFIDNVAVSAVPLPGALPLFGLAFLGLGVFGRRLRNRSKSGLSV